MLSGLEDILEGHELRNAAAALALRSQGGLGSEGGWSTLVDQASRGRSMGRRDERGSRAKREEEESWSQIQGHTRYGVSSKETFEYRPSQEAIIYVFYLAVSASRHPVIPPERLSPPGLKKGRERCVGR